MSNFGKLNLSTSFRPTFAFPVDARCFFTSYEEALAAAAKAEPIGSTNTVYYYGQKLLVDDGNIATWYTIQRNGVLQPEGTGSDTESASLFVEVDGKEYPVEMPETIE